MNKKMIETLLRDFHFQELPLNQIKLTLTEKLTIPLKNILIEKNPMLNLEIWQDKQGNQIVKGDKFLITRADKEVEIKHLADIENDILYGIIRTEISRLIRKKLSQEALFAFHAGLVSYKNEVIMIIGDKGMGKTSSCLYFLEKGADIFTDELVFFSSQGIQVLSRMISIDENNLTNYFHQFQKSIFSKSKSMLNLELKYIIETRFREAAIHDIDKILLLVDKDSYPFKSLTYLEKKKILANQLIPTQNSSDEFAINLLLSLVDKSEVTSVLNIKKRLE
ncbi:hypothetical protein A2U47_14820 [Listeria monocytogenes]|nr:hypothetical protein [Listeria monocytogenes]